MDKPQKDGSTLQQHLEVVERATGRTPKELEDPEVHEGALYLVNLYQDLRATASPVWDGSRTVSVAVMLDYQRAFGVQFTAWEVDVLLKIDRLHKRVMTQP